MAVEQAHEVVRLEPGKYTLTVTSQGFNTAQRENIEMRVADRLTLDIQLQVGVTDTVTSPSGLTRTSTPSDDSASAFSRRSISDRFG